MTTALKELSRISHAKSSMSDVIEVKSKFDAEFRRFSLNRNQLPTVEEFTKLTERLHHLESIPYTLCYTDQTGDLLPINNDDNFRKALEPSRSVLKLLIQRKGESWEEKYGYGTNSLKKRNRLTQLIAPKPVKPGYSIGLPEDFRQVSAIIDVDQVPETHRRVKLCKHGSDKPLGFYIRDGTSVRVTQQGLQKVPGIFISRLVPGGLAESTGLLAVNDEVLEVNGIEVGGKSLDQVTDMMVANSSNLIVTVKPANQRLTLGSPRRGSTSRSSQMSQGSENRSSVYASNSDDEDDVRVHMGDQQQQHQGKLAAYHSTNNNVIPPKTTTLNL